MHAPPRLPVGVGGLLRAAASVVAIGSALGPARAETPSAQPPAAESPTTAGNEEEIVVVASPEERGSIDRTTYIVKDNAEARASSALDLIGRLPSVDVSPSGQVRLIGRGGVTILIDGQEVPNADAMLRSMQGSQVAKIEVITNPSAQFPARGRGGIVNIITRRGSGDGLGGAVTGSGGSFGAYDLKISPNWNRGKVSLNGGLGLGRRISRTDQREEWDIFATGSGVDRLEEGGARSRTGSLTADLRATVDLAPKQSLSIHGQMVEFEGRTVSEAEIYEASRDSRRRSSGQSDNVLRRVSADYRREGRVPGAETSFSASHMSTKDEADNIYRTDTGLNEFSTFRVRSDVAKRTINLKLDHVRPAGDRRLLAGGHIQHNFEDSRQRFTSDSTPTDPSAVETTLAGSWSDASAYLTYQFPLWGNTVMAGTRMESRRYDIDEFDENPAGGTYLFPSLHVERKLSERLTANLSYSSRISWPTIADLDPRLRFNNPTTASSGNPLLRPEKTHSFEARLLVKSGSHNAELTAYHQKTRDLRTYQTELGGDVLVSRPVNLGTQTSRGANLQVRGPLARGLKYVFTANLARLTMGDADLAGLDAAGTSFGGSLQLEYRDGTEGRAGADHIRLSSSYSGPTETGFARISSYVRGNAHWSHGLTDRLTTVLSLSHWLRSPTSAVSGGDVVSRQWTRFRGPTINLSLTYALGSPAQ